MTSSWLSRRSRTSTSRRCAPMSPRAARAARGLQFGDDLPHRLDRVARLTAFASIVRWEVTFYLRRISTWIYFGIFAGIAFFLMLILAGAFGDLTAALPTGGKVAANSPLTLASLMPAVSLLGTSI